MNKPQKKLNITQKEVDYINKALIDPDHTVFLVAIREIIKSNEPLIDFALREKFYPGSLSNMLSKQGNPPIKTLIEILNGLGLTLSIRQKEE